MVKVRIGRETKGIVRSAHKQWWLKINTKPIRLHAMDGAIFPYIICVEYVVDGVRYSKRKWIGAGRPVPAVGSAMRVAYAQENPKRAKVLL